MATELKRLTFTITPEMEPVMDTAKKMFYNQTQSEMIRTLIIAGLNALSSSPNDDSQKNQSA